MKKGYWVVAYTSISNESAVKSLWGIILDAAKRMGMLV